MTNDELIHELKKLGYIKIQSIEDAFANILRENFVPDGFKDLAYENKPLPIEHGQTMSQPLVVAFMLDLLEVQTGDRVLEIGSGSGWQTVILSFLSNLKNVGDNNDENNIEKNIVSIERIAELYEVAKHNALKYPDFEKHIIFINGDGSRGYEEKSPFDKIIVCASTNEVPQQLKDQVKIGGRIVCPIGEKIVLLEKTGKNEFSEKEFFGFSFVPLIKD